MLGFHADAVLGVAKMHLPCNAGSYPKSGKASPLMDRPVKVPWGRGAVDEAVDVAAVDEPLPPVEAGTGATFLARAAPSAPSSLVVLLRIIVAVLIF